MRRAQQRKILDLVETLSRAQALGLYGDCQECALQIGAYIEELEGEGTKTVALLEDYYELLYSVSVGKGSENSLQKILLDIENSRYIFAQNRKSRGLQRNNAP